LQRSHVGARVELAALPRSAAITAKLAGAERALALECLLAGGDDYELLFTAPRAAAQEIEAITAVLDLPLSRIGTILRDPGLAVVDERGARLGTLPRAYDHFAQP
jgi:thiamine-monophosphate kinase